MSLSATLAKDLQMLRAEGISVFYEELRALKGVSIGLDARQITTVVGPNGSGKTTLLMTLSGLLKPRSGTIHFQENNITGMDPRGFVKAGIAHVPEGRHIFPGLSVKDNLLMGAFLRIKLKKKAKRWFQRKEEEIYSLFPILKARKNQQGGTLSGGEQQMLALSRALVAEPVLLMLDEPSMGLAPMVIDAIYTILQKLNREEGLTMLLVEQEAERAFSTAKKFYILSAGEVSLQGTTSEMRDDPLIKKTYLSGKIK